MTKILCRFYGATIYDDEYKTCTWDIIFNDIAEFDLKFDEFIRSKVNSNNVVSVLQFFKFRNPDDPDNHAMQFIIGYSIVGKRIYDYNDNDKNAGNYVRAWTTYLLKNTGLTEIFLKLISSVEWGIVLSNSTSYMSKYFAQLFRDNPQLLCDNVSKLDMLKSDALYS